ncbi:hypothetical protein FSP39_015231 [Pinctada imbricata]|uniref:G-protein coupled receptors family 1 profile domain-containing protein n=1 Tax=Pinctada imbricata TaxID=66713 RepID=A0AA89BX73_PINIB|nr:hypothetical protein FSP39_015231 [Pinctada imbricata]
MCKVYYFVWNLSYTASIIILTAIATERYIAIKFPLRARRCLTTRRLTLSQIGIWLIAAIYNIPYLIVFDTIPIKDGTKDVEFCFYLYDIIDMKTLTTLNFVVWYVIPLLSMLIMYSNIGRALWRTGSTPNHQRRLNSENIDESLCTNSSNSSDCPNHNINLKELNKKENILQGSDKVSFKKLRRNDHICAHCASQRGKSDGNGNGVSINGNDSSSTQRRSILIGITSGREGSLSTRHRMNSSNTSQIRMSSTRAIRSRRKVIRLLVAVVVSFALCVLPHHIRLLFIYWNITSPINAGLFPPLSFLILYFNSALNPVLYALFSANFRKSFREILPCKFRRRPLSFLMLDTKSEGYR